MRIPFPALPLLLAATSLSSGFAAVLAPSLHAAETTPHWPANKGEGTAQERRDQALEEIIVIGRQPNADATIIDQKTVAQPILGADVTHLVARLPGMARVGNGAMSGQVQYRGLFGERLNLRVDGQRFASGGPNLMDPVFHYAPAPLIASIRVDRGVSPVAEGPGLSAGADAVFKRIDYSDDASAVFGYDVSVAGRTSNEALEVGGVVGASTNTWRINAIGSFETSDDREFRRGTIGGSEGERLVFGVSAGVKTSVGTFSADWRRQETDPTGNPPFPMDIQYFNTEFARLRYEHSFGEVEVEGSVFYTQVDHLMDNFSQRPAPVPMRQRATFAESETIGAEAEMRLPLASGTLSIGGDVEERDHDVRITNPNNDAFFVTPFPNIHLNRQGAFVQWQGDLGPVLAEVGTRIDRNRFVAGQASLGAALPAGPRMLAAAFNAVDRAETDITWDAVARIWTPLQDGISWRVSVSRKQQMPGYIQRFGWLPINASGGLADGNIYVGDLNLESETAWSVDLGFDFIADSLYIRPTIYAREIDDYIQGVPFDDTVGQVDSPVEMIASMNGDTTPLRWANVDARLYGFDLDAGYSFKGPLRVDAVISYVRGDRRDIDDDLYRIAPLNATIALSYEQKRWTITAETRLVAEQNRVSETNSETRTGSYAVANVFGHWDISDRLRLSAGVENIFDTVYRDHLAGINRNGFGDVGIGSRLPGDGRTLFIRLNATL